MHKMNLKHIAGTAVPTVAGAIGAKLVKNLSGKMVTNPKIKAAIPLAVGIVLSGQKNSTMQHIGLGMIAVGGADLAGEFVPTLKGIENMDLSGLFGNVLNDDISDPVLNDDLGDDLSDDLSGDVLNDEMSGDDYGS